MVSSETLFGAGGITVPSRCTSLVQLRFRCRQVAQGSFSVHQLRPRTPDWRTGPTWEGTGGVLKPSSRSTRVMSVWTSTTRTWAGWHHHIAMCLMGGAFLLEPVVREILPRELFGPSVILVLRGLRRLRISGTHADQTSQATRLRENDSPGVLSGDWTDCWTIRGPVDPGVLFDAAVEGVLALTLEAALRNAALWSTRSIAQREGLNQAQSTVSGAPSR